MTIIRQDDLIESISAALQFISYYHPVDYIRHLSRAYQRERNPAAKDAIAQILTNSRMCAEGRRPLCQDTGIVNVFVKVGMDVHWEGLMPDDGSICSIADAVNEGVRRGVSCTRTTSCARSIRRRPCRSSEKEHQATTLRRLMSMWNWCKGR